MESSNGFLSENTLKNLSDKSIEKRKQAATEVGNIIDDYSKQAKDLEIRKLIESFTLLIDPTSQKSSANKANIADEDQPQRRRAGLYGLSSVAVALYQQKSSSEYLESLITPVIGAFSDKETKVQLAACDAMFNILKVCKEDIIFDKNFPNTFDKIVSVVSYPNNDVKDWGKKLVEQLEDIVYGALVKNNIFDLDGLLDKIYSKLSKSKNQDILLVLIKWIETLSSMTNVDILKCLPRFLERFFEIMSTNQKHEVYELALSQLKNFLKDYAQCQSRSVDLDIQILRKILTFLLKKKSLDIDKSRYLAILWLEEFLKFFNEDLLKESAIEDSKSDDPFFYGTYEESKKTNKEMPKRIEEEKGVNSSDESEQKEFERPKESMMSELGVHLFPEMLQCILYYINTENTDLVNKLNKINGSLQKLVMKVLKGKDELEPILITLRSSFIRGKVKTKEIAIDWFTELFKHYSDKLLSKEDEILSNIIQSINFKESKLTESVLQLLCLMSCKYHQFLKEIIEMLLERFKKEKDIEMKYINNLIHIMCSNIDQKLVFSEFAIEIRRFEQYDFVAFMIEILDLILSGAPIYKPLRDILSKSDDDEEKNEFFKTLFETWCFNPLSTLNLCFLAKKYKLAYNLLLSIGSRISFDNDKLVQLCNIVQHIESPAFLELRIDLIDPGKNYYLIKTLQGILMMIPISKAFTALKTRLECVSLDPRASLAVEAQDAKEASGASESEDKEIKEYLALFQNAMDMIDKSK